MWRHHIRVCVEYVEALPGDSRKHYAEFYPEMGEVDMTDEVENEI
jgi:hypothetical protein